MHVAGFAPATMLLAAVSFRAQPHKRGELLSVVDDIVLRMRQAPGCGRARLLVDADDSNAFQLESEWQALDTAERFFESREFQIFKGIRILLRDEPVMVLDEVQSRTTRTVRAR